MQIAMALIRPICERATYHLIIVSGQSKWKNIFSQEGPVTITAAITGLLTEDGLHGPFSAGNSCMHIDLITKLMNLGADCEVLYLVISRQQYIRKRQKAGAL